jgi:hypothetical protein
LRVFNLFNKIINLDFNLSNKNDLIKYFKKWEIYFKDVASKYKNKLNNKIKKLIDREDNSNLYFLENVYIRNYNEYIKEELRIKNLSEILDINYNNYFK